METIDRKKWLFLRHSPVLRFFALGAIALLIRNGLATLDGPIFGGGPSPVIKIDAARAASILRDNLRAAGHLPGGAEFGRILARELDDEILLREALKRRLYLDDAVSERRLINNMRFVSDHEGSDSSVEVQSLLASALDLDMPSSDPVVRRRMIETMKRLAYQAADRRSPSRDELLSFLGESASRFALPATIDFTQIFFSKDQRGSAARTDAEQLASKLEGKYVPWTAGPGDPWRFGPARMTGSRAEIAKYFGPGFTRRLWSLETRQWSDPVESAYGFHLLWIYEKTLPQAPSLEQVRSEVTYAWSRRQRQAELEKRLRRFRENYRIEIEWPGSLTAADRAGAIGQLERFYPWIGAAG